MAETKDLSGLSVSPLSIVGFIFGCGVFTAPIGLALSGVALSEIKHNPTRLRGAGLAKWGIGLSICSIFYFSTCAIAYQHNLKEWRAQIQLDEVSVNAGRDGKYPEMQMENLASFEKEKLNPPPFFNPFHEN